MFLLPIKALPHIVVTLKEGRLRLKEGEEGFAELVSWFLDLSSVSQTGHKQS